MNTGEADQILASARALGAACGEFVKGAMEQGLGEAEAMRLVEVYLRGIFGTGGG